VAARREVDLRDARGEKIWRLSWPNIGAPLGSFSTMLVPAGGKRSPTIS
jgi:hypothetical protein